MNDRQDITRKIYSFIKEYTQMDIGGRTINCPYWSNKLKNGHVVVRGFLNGKGSAFEIRRELIIRLSRSGSNKVPDAEFLRKFARRERIGIDCSGFAYQLLDELIYLHYKNCRVTSLSEIFTGGTDKTNVKALTQVGATIKVAKISDFQLGDLIRMMGGKHMAVILDVKDPDIIYAHSSNTTKIQGVHLGVIKILHKEQSLDKQLWLEKTKKGDSFGEKFFKPLHGNRVVRLKIFDYA